MVVLDLWTETSVQAHVALDTPIAWRKLGPALWQWVFRQCGKLVLLATIPADNERSLGLVRSLGFMETHRVREGWSIGVDLVLHEMRVHNCRWLEV